MIRLEHDENNPQRIYWHFEDDTTWDEFHVMLDQLKVEAQSREDSFHIVAIAGTTMPPGNAMRHLNRMIDIVHKYDTITHFIIVNSKRNPVGQAFVNLALRLFSKSGKVAIVRTMEDANALIAKA